MTDTLIRFENDFTLPSKPADVLAAWISADALRAWFAEHVDVDVREGGAFKFWGKHTIGAPAAGDADGQVVHVSTESGKLVFDWTVLGVASRVEVEVADADYSPWICGASEDDPAPATSPGCKLTVRHALHAPLNGFERPDQLIEDHWRLAVGNLMGFLDEQDGSIVLPDYAADESVVELSIEIEAPIDSVFQALTDPTELDKWFTKNARVELEPGGAFDLGWSSSPDAKICRVVEVDPPRRLTISWPDWRGDASVPDQRVHWMLEPLSPDRTKVELRHDGFLRAADRSDYQQGWAPLLVGLARVVQK